MKAIITALCISSVLAGFSGYRINSKQDDKSDNSLFVINTIEELEVTDLSLLEKKPLSDVEGNHTYDLYIFNNKSYAIASCNGVISEYCIDSKHIPFENAPQNSDLIYAGPFSYLENKDGIYIYNDTQIISDLKIVKCF